MRGMTFKEFLEMAESMEPQKDRRKYSEIMEDVKKAPYGKERRKLHKELKRDYNDGLPLFMRYPNLPIYVSAASAFIAVLGILGLILR